MNRGENKYVGGADRNDNLTHVQWLGHGQNNIEEDWISTLDFYSSIPYQYYM